MEQSYFVFWVIITFIVWYIGKIEKDNQKKIVFNVITILFFLALSFLSFGVENIVYDASLGTFVKYNEANFTLQGFLPFGFLLIMSILCALELMILIGEEWKRTAKGLQMPK